MSAEIQSELWRRFRGALEPLRRAGKLRNRDTCHGDKAQRNAADFRRLLVDSRGGLLTGSG